MDKFVFLKELSTISKDSEINQNNFELAMNFSESIDLFYATILSVRESIGKQGKIKILPMDFSTFVVPPGEFAFTIEKGMLGVFGFTFNNGCVNIREDGSGRYIATTSLYPVGA